MLFIFFCPAVIYIVSICIKASCVLKHSVRTSQDRCKSVAAEEIRSIRLEQEVTSSFSFRLYSSSSDRDWLPCWKNWAWASISDNTWHDSKKSLRRRLLSYHRRHPEKIQLNYSTHFQRPHVYKSSKVNLKRGQHELTAIKMSVFFLASITLIWNKRKQRLKDASCFHNRKNKLTDQLNVWEPQPQVWRGAPRQTCYHSKQQKHNYNQTCCCVFHPGRCLWDWVCWGCSCICLFSFIWSQGKGINTPKYYYRCSRYLIWTF